MDVYGFMYPAISTQGERRDSIDRRVSHNVFRIESYDERMSYVVRKDYKVRRR